MIVININLNLDLFIFFNYLKMNSLERSHVQDVYNSIAPHFSHTRAYMWPSIKQFISDLIPNSFIADIGCGNGKNMEDNRHVFIGADFSHKLALICKDKDNECILANNLLIPYKTEIFDATISVAVIHHLVSKESRKRCIDELIRITIPNGLIFIQVWAFEGKKYEKQDAYIDWNDKKAGKIYKRYYYLFKKNELESLIPKNKVIIEKSIEEYGNYIVILRKT